MMKLRESCASRDYIKNQTLLSSTKYICLYYRQKNKMQNRYIIYLLKAITKILEIDVCIRLIKRSTNDILR